VSLSGTIRIKIHSQLSDESRMILFPLFNCIHNQINYSKNPKPGFPIFKLWSWDLNKVPRILKL